MNAQGCVQKQAWQLCSRHLADGPCLDRYFGPATALRGWAKLFHLLNLLAVNS